MPSWFTLGVMAQPPCPHTRRRTVAEDEALKFVECLDCGEIFESDELAELPGIDESLSDA